MSGAPSEPTPSSGDDAAEIHDDLRTSDRAEVVPAQGETTSPSEPLAEGRRDYLKFIGIRSRTIDIWVREGSSPDRPLPRIPGGTAEANRRIASKLAW